MTKTVASPTFGASSAMSGQITVTTAGTEVQGTDVKLPNGVFIKALAGIPRPRGFSSPPAT
jgi:hypothetical protein